MGMPYTLYPTGGRLGRLGLVFRRRWSGFRAFGMLWGVLRGGRVFRLVPVRGLAGKRGFIVGHRWSFPSLLVLLLESFTVSIKPEPKGSRVQVISM